MSIRTYNVHVAYKQVTKKKVISTYICSLDGVCTAYHISAVEYFQNGVITGQTLIPARLNMRKKVSIKVPKKKRGRPKVKLIMKKVKIQRRKTQLSLTRNMAVTLIHNILRNRLKKKVKLIMKSPRA